MTALVGTHLAATLALVGLIWTIQLVHYPLFAAVGDESWARYHALHTVWITRLVGPLMCVEAASVAGLVFLRPAGVTDWAVWAGVALLAVVWGVTALVSVPLHERLGTGLDLDVVQKLVATNWIRTVAWTARGVLAFVIASQALGANGPSA